jgi:hypothetical protein
MFKKYFLPDFDKSKFQMIYAGTRKRYATATAVMFINDEIFICASYLNRELYLLNINTGEILFKIKTNYFNDLLDYKDGLIVTSCLMYQDKPSAIGIFKVDIDNKKIYFIKDIILEPKGIINVHGIRIIDNKTVIITCTNDSDRGLLFYDIENNKKIKLFNNFNYRPKDIFIQENKNKIYVISCSTSPSYGSYKINESILYMFEYFTLNLIDKLSFKGQIDAMTIIENEDDTDSFITLQSEDSLLHFKVKNNKIEFIKQIEGFNFPHGIGSFKNKIAVTNYGDNSIQIFDFIE